MIKTKSFAAAAIAALLAGPALAGGIVIEDAYARASSPNAMAGAAFMMIRNTGETDDRLVAASSGISQRVELHTHIEDAGGVMRMVEIEDGIPVLAGETVMLKRGGLHVMFMGLNGSMVHGESVDVTLTFEQAGDMDVVIPVDLERRPANHGGHSH
ncbi:MAG: copper chaperone PCu(A)C [Pseudomonadota bacterium]